MTIRAGVVTNLLFHAIGFNVPVDRLVMFSREDLVVGEGAMMRLQRVGKVPMTEANLDSILAATKSIFNGKYHALASRYLDGIPLGPFDDQGMRDSLKAMSLSDAEKPLDQFPVVFAVGMLLHDMQVDRPWLAHDDDRAFNL